MSLRVQTKRTYSKEECPSCGFDYKEKAGSFCIIPRGHQTTKEKEGITK